MAPMSTLRPAEVSRPVLRGRGATSRIVLTTEDALAGPLEGMACADEARIQYERIINAAIANNRAVVVQLAEYGRGRAAAYRAEFARLASAIEPDGDAA